MNLSRRILLSGLALALLSTPAFAAEQAREKGVGDVVYVPTPQIVVDAMLNLAKLGPGDFIVDLGSGDGRVVITAAKRYGVRGFGVDLSDELLQESSQAARAQGVADRVKFVKQNLFETDLSPATVITTYLLPSINLKLRPKILDMKPGTRVVTHDYHMGDWKPDAQEILSVPEKKVGDAGKSYVFLWVVPAKIAGRWQAQIGSGAERATWEFEFEQRFQAFEGTARGAAGNVGLRWTRLDADRISFQFLTNPVDDATRYEFNGSVSGDTMQGMVKVGEAAAQKLMPWSARFVRRSAAAR